MKRRDSSSSDSESAGLLVDYAMSARTKRRSDSWIVDSGATCHMCHSVMLFVELNSLEQSLEVSLGEGHVLEATGRGTVLLELKLPRRVTKQCKLRDVLYVLKPAHNLLSVSKAAEEGKTTEVMKNIVDAKKRLMAAGTRKGSLYYLDCLTTCTQVYVAADYQES